MAGEFFIAKKYFFSKKKVGLISATAFISISGFAIGVWALIIALSVLGGFEREVRDKILSFDSHIKIESSHGEGISDWENLKTRLIGIANPIAIAPYVTGKAIIIKDEKQSVVILKGTTETGLSEVSKLSSSIIEGDIKLEHEDIGGIVVGRNIAERLLVGAGDTVVVINPLVMNSPFSVPYSTRFVVTGIFSANIFNYDDAYTYVHYKYAQKFKRMADKVTGIEMSFGDFNESFKSAELLKASGLDGMKVMTWFDIHRDLLGAMKLEKLGAFVVLSLIILVAAFNVVSSLVMMVMDKRREIGILKALGAKDRSVGKIFILSGMFSGIIGISLGTISALFIIWIQKSYGLLKLPSDVYFINVLPVELDAMELMAVILVSLTLGFLATLYPALKAANLQPVESIHYE